MSEAIIKSIAILILILLLLILGQQPFFQRIGKAVFGKIGALLNYFWQKIVIFWNTYIAHKVAIEVQKGQENLQQEVQGATRGVLDNLTQKIKNYLWDLFTK